jgi:hypothetical protein
MVVITSSRLKSAFLFTPSPVRISMRSQLVNHYHTLAASSLQRVFSAFCMLGSVMRRWKRCKISIHPTTVFRGSILPMLGWRSMMMKLKIVQQVFF